MHAPVVSCITYHCCLYSLLYKAVPVDSDAEKDRYKERQLQQHLLALMYLLQAAKKNVPLTVDLIKTAHQVLMADLYTEKQEKIEAGEYRQGPVSTGLTHTYPDYKCIPSNMDKIVMAYNEKAASTDHDELVLASSLLTDVVSLHPVLDGNGRLSRLLWCYSLMSPGLPFPVIPFQGKSKAYELYIKCINYQFQNRCSMQTCIFSHTH